MRHHDLLGRQLSLGSLQHGSPWRAPYGPREVVWQPRGAGVVAGQGARPQLGSSAGAV